MNDNYLSDHSLYLSILCTSGWWGIQYAMVLLEMPRSVIFNKDTSYHRLSLQDLWSILLQIKNKWFFSSSIRICACCKCICNKYIQQLLVRYSVWVIISLPTRLVLTFLQWNSFSPWFFSVASLKSSCLIIKLGNNLKIITFERS